MTIFYWDAMTVIVASKTSIDPSSAGYIQVGRKKSADHKLRNYIPAEQSQGDVTGTPGEFELLL